MLGLMQNRPLLISGIVDYVEQLHSSREIVSRDPEGVIHRSNYGEIAARAKRLANSLMSLGLQPGDRVATLAWNSYRHLEIYYGVTCSGLVLHTVNPRLFPEQLQFIMGDAEDAYVCFDPVFAPLISSLSPHLPRVKGWIALCDRDHMPHADVANLFCYEDVLAAGSPHLVWPTFDENTACTLCYTSGTTGNPKGVLYSHRSTVLHGMAANGADALALSARDSILMVVPLFHANAWSLPFSGAMSGAKMILPGPKLDPESLYTLIEREACTKAFGIPTIWLNFLAWVETNKSKAEIAKLKLRTVVSGGAAAPRATIEKLHDLLGAYMLHAWGMTETSPLATTGALLAKHEGSLQPQIVDVQVKQGRQVFGIEVGLFGKAGEQLPHDGLSVGELKVRGNWVISGYFKGAGGKVMDDEGWFGTGDVAVVDPDGYVRLTDRLKDVIKSGGEWISSIDIENIAVSHPDVFEAAVIAIHHPVWQERPLLLIHPRPGRSPTKESILEFLSSRIAKWWMPNDVIFVESLPHTATGKLLKTDLREKFGGRLAVTG
jgi:acyl-CoA synthetase (AMP-forming)/AMP-acid ligase II